MHFTPAIAAIILAATSVSAAAPQGAARAPLVARGELWNDVKDFGHVLGDRVKHPLKTAAGAIGNAVGEFKYGEYQQENPQQYATVQRRGELWDDVKDFGHTLGDRVKHPLKTAAGAIGNAVGEFKYGEDQEENPQQYAPVQRRSIMSHLGSDWADIKSNFQNSENSREADLQYENEYPQMQRRSIMSHLGSDWADIKSNFQNSENSREADLQYENEYPQMQRRSIMSRLGSEWADVKGTYKYMEDQRETNLKNGYPY